MFQNALAYIIIPVYTILFVHNTNLFTTNFSVISTWSGKQNAFILWGILVGWYFFRELQAILPLIPNSRKERHFTIFSCILLALALITPYFPEKLPYQAFFHVVCAFFASVLLMLCLFSLILKLYCDNPLLYRPYLAWLVITAFLSLFLFLAAGIVSSALEIFFTISCTLLIRRLHRRILSKQPASPK